MERQGSPKSSQNTSNGEARDGMQGELTVHELCAYRDAVLHKKGTEESDDVRRVALQSRQEAVWAQQDRYVVKSVGMNQPFYHLNEKAI